MGTELREGLPPLPARMLRLPRDGRGYPIPWFVATMEDGSRDFRIADGDKLRRSLLDRRCWVCGEKMGRYVTFVIGPMCAVNRTTSEPACHIECALFSATACPFLTLPKAKRNEAGIPEGLPVSCGPPEGAIQRNPGVMCLWTCSDFEYQRFPSGGLFRLGEPLLVQWFAQKRVARREEILASVDSGMPLLQEMAAREGSAAIKALDGYYQRMLAYLPAA